VTWDAIYRRDPNDDTDLDLLREVVCGEHPAWSVLYDSYAEMVYKQCRREGLPHEDAEDVMQEVFWNVHKRLEHFDRGVDGSFRGWLYRICQRRIVDRQRIFTRWRLQAAAANSRNADHEACETSVELELAAALELARARVSAGTWLLFDAYELQGRPASAVAAEFNVSRFRVYHARTRVVELLRLEIREIEGNAKGGR